ncbi:glucose-6-phosphate dehydrogenase [Candidatus Peribacteria bacterium RIFOXYC2_FULL_55_14]|nr:MAG: Glucose-6-phosphate 1-dehydrogenase [Candidatus Peribacteria bacterium GW2011_GWC2_54_8]OGJ72406.1 MAG: glucose-6-phosphate dehydrogenase [Candidatus Peribacteria bacterium RIFOXYA1_FULL_56_14]OGJ73455.1 MAG: glucose-6-phosphate dehydrogenase [Candidatus Peribacteria bacterium RIFOXYA2_FULL_55_28]OGJ74636.1 MAG: glucose-6-phosphate dehydrogenase [Candidatus Peribacteria bacterium RIFOXYB1_FULL_54_35]OGJ76802.1 MAG: glucose-6-phosphate dehydrogenase [Candidatus Peribacteria bacterium RIF
MLAASSPFSLVLFGASGHLAKQKIYPALYVLALKKRLPKEYCIVGFSRSEMDDSSFREHVAKAVRAGMPEVTEKALSELLSHMYYQRGQYDKKEDFIRLNTRLLKIEKGWENRVRLAYLSIPPTVFAGVLRNLCAGGIHTHEQRGDFRCIIEKPVGHDLQSAEEIQKELSHCFEEKEIYLLDHYLGKEAVRNVYYLRFANPILEQLCKNTLIHHVQISAAESAGLEGRTGYFESTGALRDMFQSHLLMVASLLTMRLEGDEAFRTNRFKAMEQFYLPPATDLNDIVLQGQYSTGELLGRQVAGYTEEKGIAADSRTNTFIALKILSRTARWQGVPFYLRSGKRLEKKETRITIQFQEPHLVGKGSSPNRLDIILHGEAGMRVYMQTKLGGTEPEFRPLILEDPLVCFGDCLPEHGLLLLEAIHGKQQWYLSFNEVRFAWRLLDPIQAHLTKPNTPLYTYTAGTEGPKEAGKWVERDGIHWF